MRWTALGVVLFLRAAASGEPAAVAIDGRHPLSALVPAGEGTRSRHGLDDRGRFACQQEYHVLPSAEDASCPMANGYELQGSVEFLSAPGQAAEAYAVEPLRLWRRARCGERRDPVAKPARSLLERLAPGLGRRPPVFQRERFRGQACVDNRLSIEIRGAHHEFVHGTVHRFEPVAPEGRIALYLGQKMLREWSLRQEPASGRCPADPPRQVPWSLDLEVICQGDHAVMTARVWRLNPSSACVAHQEVSPPLPEDLECAPGAPRPIGWQSSGWQRVRVRLQNGSMEPIVFPAPSLFADR